TASGSKARQPPWRFEAGTPAIEAAVGLGAAVDYLQAVGLEEVDAHCRLLRAQARERLRATPGGRPLGGAGVGARPPSFTAARPRSDGAGVCVRSGSPCAQPLHEHLGSPPSLRVSFQLYNQPWEIDLLFDALNRILTHGG